MYAGDIIYQMLQKTEEHTMGYIPLLTAGNTAIMKSALIALVIINISLFICAIFFTIYLNRKKRIKTLINAILLGVLYTATVVAAICTLLSYKNYQKLQTKSTNHNQSIQTDTPDVKPDPGPSIETITPSVDTEPDFQPHSVHTSNPDNWGVKWEIIADASIVSEYRNPSSLSFSRTEYTNMEGVITFRGNNYRNNPTYGFADVSMEILAEKWHSNIGAYNGWSGSGWTGQPLIVRWDEETKRIMNLFPEKKDKTNLVEVIYATLDGHVYFYDLDDGSYTRNPVFLGMNFKGAGSLDPRGYPIMYVGSGDVCNGVSPRMFIVSLIDGTVLYEKSGADGYSNRPSWSAFDSAPLVHSESDTLIWPGENGILYTLKLNTQYDKDTGTISVSPAEAAKARYTTELGRTYGYECSCVVVDHYFYAGDNGGMFFCVDLETMELVWALDTKDDVNATPVFQWEEDGKGYIYTATSMEFSNGTSYIYKIDALTGEIIWQKDYSNIIYDKDVSGGVLSSPILGKEGTELEGLVIYSVSKTPRAGSGILVALNTETGDVVWEKELASYCWSSPVPLYTQEGNAYIVICDSVGNVILIDGQTGETLSQINIGSNVEASPAVFEGTLVVGTRGGRVYAIDVD